MTNDQQLPTPLRAYTAVAPGDVVTARRRLIQRRGLTGRWYRAEAVDELLDVVTARLAAVMTELERTRRLNRRLMDIDHRRRFGTLPSGMAPESLTSEAIQRRIDEQDAIDQMLQDASEQAAAIIREAREQYLRTTGMLGSHLPGPRDPQLAERAETRLREARSLLEQWAAYLVDRDRADQRAADQRSAELRAAYEAAAAALHKLDL